MAKFTDSTGRIWVVRITGGSLRRVRELLDVRLAALADDNGKGLFELLDDAEQFINVLFVLCEDQAGELAVTDLQFAKLLGDIELDAAATAFLEAYSSFFKNRVGASLLPVMAARAKALAVKMTAEASQALDAMTDEVLLTKLRERSGNTPASPASIPTPTPSAS